MTTITIGSNLTAKHGSGFRSMIQKKTGFTAKGQTGKSPVQHKYFVKVATGDVTANKDADSPGSNCCFIHNVADDDLWFVYDWVSSTSFKVAKIVPSA